MVPFGCPVAFRGVPSWDPLTVLNESLRLGSSQAASGNGGDKDTEETEEQKMEEKKLEEAKSMMELTKDAEVGRDIIFKATEADWWNWSAGSTLIFWRWPSGFQRRCARDGMPAWIQGTLPRFN
jgi:hypothetical protein